MSPFPLGQAPKIVPTLPTPTLPPSALPSFTVICSTTIAAPPLAVLAKLLDTTTWPAWNTFCKSATVTHAPAAADVAPLNAPELQALAVGRPGYLYPGVRVTFAAYMTADAAAPNRPREVVTALEAFERDGDGRRGYRVAWRFESMPDVVLHAERVQELVEVVGEDGVVVATEYYSWETFRGLLAPVLKWSKQGELRDGFARWMGSLKAVAEGGSHDEHDVARLQTLIYKYCYKTKVRTVLTNMMRMRPSPKPSPTKIQQIVP